MSYTPWLNENWHTSPWNFAPEVTKDWNFPEKIQIHDVTLRDGEQQAGIAFDYDDKIRIAEGLAEIGVHRIEAGMPVVSRDDARVVQDLAKRNFGPKIYSFARCMVDDVRRAVDAGVSGVIMEVPASQHLIEKGYRWELERAIDLSIEATKYAHDQGLEVVFFPIDFFTGGQSPTNAAGTFARWIDHRWNNEVWRPEYASVDFAGTMRKVGFDVTVEGPPAWLRPHNILGIKPA